MVDAACTPEAPEGEDAHYLREAFHLGLLGAGYTAPNPTVGALVISGGTEVGRGVHRICGRARQQRGMERHISHRSSRPDTLMPARRPDLRPPYAELGE